MENSGETFKPEIKNDSPEKQVLKNTLAEIYQNHRELDQNASMSNNMRYRPSCALESGYKYVPVAEAIDMVPDPYNIFPRIEPVIKNSQKLSNSEIVHKIAETIIQNTDVSVVIEPFQDSDQAYGQLNNGRVYFKRNSGLKDVFGIHTQQYDLNNGLIDYQDPKGDVILINELKIDRPSVIQTVLHEFGHIVEEKTLDKKYNTTEVISSLYGIKTGLMFAETDPQKSADIIQDQINIYNWILTGTVAP